MTLDSSPASLEQAFHRVVGRAPTDTDLAGLYRLQKGLRLPDDDPVWGIFFALQHYETLYEKIPPQIEAAAQKIHFQVDRLDELLQHGPATRASGTFQQASMPAWYKKLSRRGRVLIQSIGLLLVIAGAALVVRTSFGSPSVAVAALDEGNDLATCFHGTGRIERRGDRDYCFPVTSDGRVLGFAIRGR